MEYGNWLIRQVRNLRIGDSNSPFTIMLESLLVCENDVLNILDLIEDTYLDEELKEYDDFTPLLRSIKNSFPQLCEEGSICHTILKMMSDKITEKDAETIIELIEDAYVNEELGEYDDVMDLIKHLRSIFPNLFRKGDICENILE